jgi:putative ABC transport system ATP-binding protein
MNVIGCLDRPDSGHYLLEGRPVGDLNRRQLADIRNQRIGFVFQGFNLLARTTALENVMLPLLYTRGGLPSAQLHLRAVEALRRVGLADRMHHEPNQLSGGQQQRVAIARALVNDPAIILADEPTGNLDSRTTLDVLALFQELNDKGITIVLVTHEGDVAEHAGRIIEMQDGRIRRDFPVVNRRRA